MKYTKLMIEKKIKLNITKPFGTVLRKKLVLIAFIQGGKLILSAKDSVYPPGIYRFFGGGVDDDEDDFLVAAQRETTEETGLKIAQNRFEKLIDIHYQIVDDKLISYELNIVLYVIFLEPNELIHPSDDVDRKVAISKKGFNSLIKRYSRLHKNLWYKDELKNVEYKYEDFARIHNPINKLFNEWWTKKGD